NSTEQLIDPFLIPQDPGVKVIPMVSGEQDNIDQKYLAVYLKPGHSASPFPESHVIKVNEAQFTPEVIATEARKFQGIVNNLSLDARFTELKSLVFAKLQAIEANVQE